MYRPLKDSSMSSQDLINKTLETGLESFFCFFLKSAHLSGEELGYYLLRNGMWHNRFLRIKKYLAAASCTWSCTEILHKQYCDQEWVKGNESVIHDVTFGNKTISVFPLENNTSILRYELVNYATILHNSNILQKAPKIRTSRVHVLYYIVQRKLGEDFSDSKVLLVRWQIQIWLILHVWA